MLKWNVSARILALIALMGAAFTTGCYKPGSQSQPTLPDSAISVTGKYNSSSDYYLWAVGSCAGSEAISISYSSSLTPSQTTEIPCTKNGVKNSAVGEIASRLTIQNGEQAQVFTVVLTARQKNIKSKPKRFTVNYTPPTPSSPGFGITSGGDVLTDMGNTLTVHSSIGELFSPKDIDGGTIKAKTGLQGALDP